MLIAEESKRYSLSLSYEDRCLIALSMVPNIGPRRSHALLRYFGSAAAISKASSSKLARVSGVGKHIADSISDVMQRVDQEVERQFELADRCGAQLVRPTDANYPPRLAEIFDPPGFLWVRGDLEALSQKSMAMVGTRIASDYGKQMSRQFATDLVNRGYCVCSGLAYGIDTEAHKGAVVAGGRTVAVLGSGIDVIYPRKNIALVERILERGCLVSEFAMGTKPDAKNFPKRNRIISGMSDGTIVVEAREKGGALITATMALDQNREVFAVPGPADSAKGRGSNNLIRDGLAKLVCDLDDVLVEFEGGQEQPDLFTAADLEAQKMEQLTDRQKVVWGVLGSEPVHIDEIALDADLSSTDVLILLLELELKGFVCQRAGRHYLRS